MEDADLARMDAREQDRSAREGSRLQRTTAMAEGANRNGIIMSQHCLRILSPREPTLRSRSNYEPTKQQPAGGVFGEVVMCGGVRGGAREESEGYVEESGEEPEIVNG